MRGACGLKVRDRRIDHAPGAGIMLSQEATAEVSPDTEMKAMASFLMDRCLQDGKDSYTLSMFKYIGLPSSAPNLDHTTIWQRLLSNNLFASVHVEGRRAKILHDPS